jgi:carboxypeptidase PM20D1
VILNILLIVVVVLFFLAAFMLVRTLMFARPFTAAEPVELAEVESEVVAEHLSSIIKCETVSLLEDDPTMVRDNSVAVRDNPAERRAFYELQLRLHEMYPRLHATLEQQIFNDFSLLYTWKGKNPELPPAVLMAHVDVVPAAPESLDQWEYPPFSGAIADGFVWGRGTLDIKSQVIGLMESVETLLKHDYQPERTIYLAFGHDEEIGGANGGKRIAQWFADNEIRPGVVLDEGSEIVEGRVPGVAVPVALVGTAEKGSLVLQITAETQSGHSAFPPKQSSIGVLSQAIAFLEHEQMPAHVSMALPLLKCVAAAMPFTMQLALANLWLFRGLIQKRLEANPETNALIRTTTAPTIIHAGNRPNVLPGIADAAVNFRLRPGDTIAKVCDHVRKVIDDPRVRFEVREWFTWEASPVSETDATSYRLLERTIQQVYDNVPVAPYLVLGATDARHYRDLCDQIYRFTPVLSAPDDLHRVHGLNERIGVAAMGKMVQFYVQLIKSWGEDF